MITDVSTIVTTTELCEVFIHKHGSEAKEPVFEGTVGNFYITKRLYDMRGEWDKDGLNTTETPKLYIENQIRQYSIAVDLNNQFAETFVHSFSTVEISEMEARQIEKTGGVVQRNDNDKPIRLQVERKTNLDATGYRHFQQGKNKAVQQLFKYLQGNIPNEVEACYHRRLLLDMLFNYCNGYAKAKYVADLQNKLDKGNFKNTGTCEPNNFNDLLLGEGKKILLSLKEMYSNTKPMAICYMLYALHELSILPHPNTLNQTDLLRILKTEFSFRGTRQSLNTNISHLNKANLKHNKQIELHRKQISEMG